MGQSRLKQSLFNTCIRRADARDELLGMLGLDAPPSWRRPKEEVTLEPNGREIRKGEKCLLHKASEGGE